MLAGFSLALGEDASHLDQKTYRSLILHAPRPEYPYLARDLRETGKGLFTLTVNTATGKVTAINVDTSTGRKRLDWACIKAFMQWRFRPGVVRKVRIPVTFLIRG